MRALVFAEYGAPEVLHIAELPDPAPGPGEVRIAVRAVGVNPVDWKLRSGALQGMIDVELPAIVGYEASGVVDAVGAEVTRVAIGDAVFGHTVAGGTAEYALLSTFATKPEGASWEEAAALAVAVDTSERCFTTLGGLEAGQTVLVTGAAGGVGSTAVQLAALRGARVIGTASPGNHDFLRSLGVTPTTYDEGLPERVREIAPEGVDLAIDTAGKGALPDLIALTGDPQRVVTIADFTAPELGVRMTTAAEGRAPDALDEVAELIAAGRFKVAIDRVFSFADAAEAQRVSERGHLRGKLILVPSW